MLKKKLKDGGILLLFVILLPYAFTTLVNGRKEEILSFHERVGEAEEERIILGEARLTVDEYVIGVVMGCVDGRSEEEALKAQIIIARTNTYREMDGKREIDSQQMSQKYMDSEKLQRSIGYEEFQNDYIRLEKLARETEKEVIYYGQKLIDGAYHAVSGGMTRRLEGCAYLCPIESPWDIDSEQFLSILYMSEEEVMNRIHEQREDISLEKGEFLKKVDITKRDEAGYVDELKIKETKIRGEEFRKWMDLPSAHFSIDELEDKIRFTVKGLGHGVGLSQYGANEMAKRGYSYKEIINYYYQDVEIRPYGA